jgi:hypothetical protein
MGTIFIAFRDDEVFFTTIVIGPNMETISTNSFEAQESASSLWAQQCVINDQSRSHGEYNSGSSGANYFRTAAGDRHNTTRSLLN